LLNISGGFSLNPFLEQIKEIVEFDGYNNPHQWRIKQEEFDEKVRCCNINCYKSINKKEVKFCICKKVAYCGKECQRIQRK
jgi:hypothetical protein